MRGGVLVGNKLTLATQGAPDTRLLVQQVCFRYRDAIGRGLIAHLRRQHAAQGQFAPVQALYKRVLAQTQPVSDLSMRGFADVALNQHIAY